MNVAVTVKIISGHIASALASWTLVGNAAAVGKKQAGGRQKNNKVYVDSRLEWSR